MTGVEGKLRERIGCCGRTWSTSETWELRTENRSFVVRLKVCVSIRGQAGKRGKLHRGGQVSRVRKRTFRRAVPGKGWDLLMEDRAC